MKAPTMSSATPAVTKTEDFPARKTRWAWTVATFFGVGYLKPGPGTYGSIAAMLLWAAESMTGHLSARTQSFGLLIWIAGAIILGVPAATIVERESGGHDPGFVVIDEVVGQWIALLGIPFDWRHGVIALLLFRLFDITKPFPVRRFERLPAGWGIVFDDVGAGLYALCIASVLRIWI